MIITRKSWIINKINPINDNKNDLNFFFPWLKIKYVKIKMAKYSIGFIINGILKIKKPIVVNKVACPIIKEDIAKCSM